MTKFTTPEIVACPHCQQHYTRQRLCTFNNKWQIIFSDGGTTYDLEFVVFNETRCTHCQQIILDVQNLPSLGLLPELPFWKRWFSKKVEYQHLPKPTSDVYLELFEHCSADKKMFYALKAYRKFNQTHKLETKTIKPSQAALTQYKAAEAFILASPPSSDLPEYHLLCADIYRLRGQFENALACYAKVTDERLQYIVEQGIAWTHKKITLLMPVRSKQQHYEDKNGPVAPPENKVYCNINGQKLCPNHWNNLTRVSDSLKQRLCNNCNQRVHHISSLEAFKHHSQLNHCIAANIEQLKLSNDFSKILNSKSKLNDEDFDGYGVGESP
ncbi:hypothetical protein [Paraglaciecola aestuariivivens]